MTREEAVELVNVYIRALKSGDYSSVKFSSSVSFLGPLHDEPLTGRNVSTTLRQPRSAFSEPSSMCARAGRRLAAARSRRVVLNLGVAQVWATPRKRPHRPPGVSFSGGAG